MTRHGLDAPDVLSAGEWVVGTGGVSRWVDKPASESHAPERAEDPALAVLAGAAHSAAMSKIDGCPECVLNAEPPRSAVPVEGAWRCGYLCSDCGHAWTTDWRD